MTHYFVILMTTAFFVLIAGALLSFLLPVKSVTRGKIGHASAAVGSLIGIAAVFLFFSTLSYSSDSLFVTLFTFGWFDSITLKVDNLAALFLLLFLFVGLAVSLFSYQFVSQETHPAWQAGLFNFFLLSLFTILLANHSILFLFAWEIMSLTSAALVLTRHQDSSVRKSGYVYLAMTHFGTGFLIMLFMLLTSITSSFQLHVMFAAIRDLPFNSSFFNHHFILFLAFIGFGTKAGIVPLHIWLPRAHPSAPTQISAIMSGLMVKTAIFGLIRVFYHASPETLLIWGWVFLLAGCASTVLGAVLAFSESDFKRMLAYSTVENIGIIIVALGVSLLFFGKQHFEFAAFSLLAALLHSVNHALFKSLLFLSGGYVYQVTHLRDMERLGGLIKFMPLTAFFFLIGSLAISSLPPLNGFISEWLMLQSLLQLAFNTVSVESVASIFIISAMVFAGATAAGAFIKGFSMIFLAMPRSDYSVSIPSNNYLLHLGMSLLGLLCLLLGLVPGFFIQLLLPIATNICNTQPLSLDPSWMQMPNFQGLSTISPAAILLITFAAALTVWFILVAFYGQNQRRLDETWNCGLKSVEPHMEYTPTSFSMALLTTFRPNYIEIIERYIYRPVTNYFLHFSSRLRDLQSGSIHRYLFYIFITLVFLLLINR